MSVIVSGVEKGSLAARAGISTGDTVVKINGEAIMDVLDYRFYQENVKLSIELLNAAGSSYTAEIVKEEYEDIGLLFDTYLMDNKRSCRNKCVFCFIDQLPKGLRESLYFKDDDSRLSFLFGNYITLTNITEHEVQRIIKMHISPINISVHTTDPELRVRMMTNKSAGQALEIIERFNKAGIKMNCQLVLCPGYNDGMQLEKSLKDLTAFENVECIAAVPVGLTRYRDNLAKLEPFNATTAASVLDIIDRFGDFCVEQYGDRRVYGADEFYLISKREMPQASYYGDFLQLENGVGLWALLKDEAQTAIKQSSVKLRRKRKVTMATGTAAFPLINEIAKECTAKWGKLTCNVHAIENNFFGGKISVAGLITATDLIDQLSGCDLGDELLIPAVMLRNEGDMFLDSITLGELSQQLKVKVTPVPNDGYVLIDAILGQ